MLAAGAALAEPGVGGELKPAPDGSWAGAGLDFSVAGRWSVVVYVQQKSGGTTVDLQVPVGPVPTVALAL